MSSPEEGADYYLESGFLPKHDGDLATAFYNGFLKNRIPWRGDSDMNDGQDVGLDLTGGWHGAGDHVKFAHPMAFSAAFADDPDYQDDTTIASDKRIDGWYDYRAHAENFLGHRVYGGVPRTPGGMAWLTGWGSARYSTMTSFLTPVHRKYLIGINEDLTRQRDYLDFATEQIDYVLGDNPPGMRYVVGFGDNWSQVAHRRAPHGSSRNNIYEPELPRHVLLKFRYFVDLREVLEAGYTADDVTVHTYCNEGNGYSPLTQWKDTVCYTEGSFEGIDHPNRERVQQEAHAVRDGAALHLAGEGVG